MPNLQKEEAVALGEGKVDPTLLKGQNIVQVAFQLGHTAFHSAHSDVNNYHSAVKATLLNIYLFRTKQSPLAGLNNVIKCIKMRLLKSLFSYPAIWPALFRYSYFPNYTSMNEYTTSLSIFRHDHDLLSRLVSWFRCVPCSAVKVFHTCVKSRAATISRQTAN